ncbi:cardiolipin synthase [Psychromonas sp. psych-6C06]|uniref:cardiolipin synthase n=1 Tax=Psychromonas sp. psych-6C06 TaxID=2058089 RepID=UPI000C34EC7E|nr:cardiolipin synthase [Psychromonas sp. psych-6C06]PKF63102.1 cardiolipin synthase [Psychromonas sp. psych-6C06]
MDVFSFDKEWLENAIYVALSATFYFTLLLGTSLRVILKRKPIGVSLAWLFLIYAIPLLGIISYFIFGELHLGKKRQVRSEKAAINFTHWLNEEVQENRLPKTQNSAAVESMQRFVEGYSGVPMMQGNDHHILDSTDHILREITEQIKTAQTRCYLMFYICNEGGLVDPLLVALMDAAKRGVECKLLFDSVGSHDFFKGKTPKQLINAGVEVVEALPVGVFRSLFQRQDLRLHRKLVCIDDSLAYTGSMNLVDPAYFKKDQDVGEWVDVMVRCKGPIIQQMQGLFLWDWYLETNQNIMLPKADATRFPVEGEHNSLLIPSGPGFGIASIHQVLISAIYGAKYSLVLTTPYFVPDDSLLAALQVAALRGVDVKIILPAKNDSKMVKYASRAFFEELLNAGVKIHKFYGGLLHTKSIVIDEKIALIGTVNLDRRSFWLNFEMTMLIDNSEFAGELLTTQMHYLLESQQIVLSEWNQRSYYKKLLESSAYLFSPLL